MRRRVAILSLLAAWFLATGNQWDFVQVFAWTRMFAGYVETMSVRNAIEETFDGEKPCALCCAVRRAKERENKEIPPEARLRDKLVLVYQPTVFVVSASSVPEKWREACVTTSGRDRARPAVPPPRA
jgi:hypothetical protein